MTTGKTAQYEQRGQVGLVTLQRADAMNAFNEALRRDLHEALEAAADDERVRAVVLHGEGRSFCAGADLKGGLDTEKSVEHVLQEEYRPIFERIDSMPKPVIAAVGGSAAGIGMSLALSCDLVLMAEDAFLLSPFTTISLVPDGGLNWHLVQQLGYRRAFQLSVESERIPAARCVDLGLANRAVSADRLLADALAWGDSIAERAPLSVAATKRAMRHAASGSWATTFDIEASLQDTLRDSEDCSEGVAAFLDKRKAEFKGR